ncbi:MAG TPA: hypothetical protein VFI86_06335 [Burkholderiales bacterium]|nr:hypothetical protein [Burkholderiales bacterium]
MSPRFALSEFDFEALKEQAHRERAEAVRRMFAAAFATVADRIRHAARTHRHPQGTHRRAAA